jgi:ribosomal RNA-processing protein 7
LPPDTTERELVLLFKECGTIVCIVFDSDSYEKEDELSESEGEKEVV